MRTYEISTALKKRFSDSRRYVYAEEVGVTTGGGCRRLDMVVMDCYWSNGFRIDGFEYKISTSDLRRELEDSAKHAVFFDVLDYYTLACPADVVNPVYDIIPPKWGVLIVNDDGTTRYKRKPISLHDENTNDMKMPRGFMASFVRATIEHTPSEQELQAEYAKGLEEGKKKAESHIGYMTERVKRDAAKLEAYDKLSARFGIWRDDDIDSIMDEFEAFRNLRTEWVKADIDSVIKSLTELKGKI